MLSPALNGRLDAAVAALRERPITPRDKGFGCLAPVSAAELAARRPALLDGAFTMPVLVLRESALRHNIAAMAGYCAAAGVLLAPHGKTPMAPQLMARQLTAGAWAITAATIGQVQICRSFGVPRILLANELTDRAGIAWLAAEMAADASFDCYVYADSLEGVRLLDETFGAGPAGRRLPVLVELGFPGGRTGCRTLRQAVAVAEAVSATASLRLAGAAGYEGGIGPSRDPATLDAVAAFCRDLRRLGDLLDELADGSPGGPRGLILSAGGSAYFDVVVAELTAGGAGGRHRVVLRSGAYVAHDHGMYAGLAPGGVDGAAAEGSQQDGQALPAPPALTPALELWAQVLSRPEPDLALLCAGRRDVPFDHGLPVPLRVHRTDGPPAAPKGMKVTGLDDQHAYLSLPANAELAPGDLVCLGISHPCTAFDKWRVIPVVDDDYRVVDAVHTFF
jgi:D-serine dehydratase